MRYDFIFLRDRMTTNRKTGHLLDDLRNDNARKARRIKHQRRQLRGLNKALAQQYARERRFHDRNMKLVDKIKDVQVSWTNLMMIILGGIILVQNIIIFSNKG